MRIHFIKMSGAGNDFIVIDNRQLKIRNKSRLARRLCDRRWGIGADGLLLLENSTRADYKMCYFNSDGSYGGMCGNGGRCIALYAYLARIAGRKHQFVALNYVYRAEVRRDEVALQMKNPSGSRFGFELKTSIGIVKASFVDAGSPHVVIASHELGKNLDAVPVRRLGQEIRGHRLFKRDGTNVNFIEVTGVSTLKMRTYERGVEDETLACGTGAVACSVVGNRVFGLKTPVQVITRSGRKLLVDFHCEKDGIAIRDVVLRGPAEVTYEGYVVA